MIIGISCLNTIFILRLALRPRLPPR
ncbi:hypothetical protein PENVUL_c224G03617, partial [Penicillium vulpinum]